MMVMVLIGHYNAVRQAKVNTSLAKFHLKSLFVVEHMAWMGRHYVIFL
jgi:hypothetical protein